MKKLKYEILFIILFMTVGIAAVSSNLLINGTTPIESNPNDFLIYFSDVKVNGVQDLSLVEDEATLVFNGEFSVVGDKKEITYDVTNASKNYDADIEISCTQSTSYLTITNDFDVESNLPARSTRSGVLTIILSKSYTGADLKQDISCTINASAVERSSQGSGNVVRPVSKYYIGKEISIGEEKFNVISDNGDTITLLAQYNISKNSMRQSTVQDLIVFATKKGWEVSSGGSDIDVQIWGGTGLLNILNGYVNYLKSDLGISSAEGNLITLSQLKYLGCDDSSCTMSPYKSWLINNQFWWTSTSKNVNSISAVYRDGTIINDSFDAANAVRPVITISKSTLEEIGQVRLITFTIEGKVYYAEEGMTWGEWVDSSYNTAGLVLSDIHIVDEREYKVYNVTDGFIISNNYINSGSSYIFSSAYNTQ